MARPLRKGELMGEISELGRMIGTLFLLLAGVVGVAILARRFLPLNGQRNPRQGPLQPLGLLALTPQCSVALVQAGQDTLVLGLTPQTVTLLTKVAEPTPRNPLVVVAQGTGVGGHSSTCPTAEPPSEPHVVLEERQVA